MNKGPASSDGHSVDHYNATYGLFQTDLWKEIRKEIYEDDFGQNNWSTTEEYADVMSWLELGPESRLLDVACGSGGPTLRMVKLTGCEAVGVDAHEDGIKTAVALATHQKLSERVTFQVCDASESLPFDDGSFDAIFCNDAINHLRDRAATLGDWYRVLRSGGRLVFTDPITVTGALSSEEIAVRSSIGFFLFVPQGIDEKLVCDTGFELLLCEDWTDNLAEFAWRWHIALTSRKDALIEASDRKTTEGQIEFFRIAHRIAAERRLSRFVFSAKKP